jgi:hypothetical protein
MAHMATKSSNLHRTLKRAALPAAALVLIAFFGLYAVFGERADRLWRLPAPDRQA